MLLVAWRVVVVFLSHPNMAGVCVPRVDGQQPQVHPTGHQYSIFSALVRYVHLIRIRWT